MEVPTTSADVQHEALAQNPSPSPKRGFATLPPARRHELASAGGKAAHAAGVAHKFTTDEARAAGKIGGNTVAKNRQHMAEIGRKGGQRTSQDKAHMAEIGRKGGAVVSSDREHMRDIGGRRRLKHAHGQRAVSGQTTP